jgi:hypothetical protein
MTSDFRFLKIFGLAAAAVLTLAACQNPTSVPAGYAWHQGEYNSPPGAKPQPIGYPWSAQLNAESAAHWRVAARDIVRRIVAASGVSSVPLYVEPSRARTPFTTTFDNFLREELLNAGFVLAAVPGSGPVMRYDATVVDHKAVEREEVKLKDGEQAVVGGEAVPLLPMTGSEVVINANVSGGGLVLAEVTGVYYIPEAAEYNYREPMIRTMPIVGKR